VFECPYCSKQFETDRGFRIHLRKGKFPHHFFLDYPEITDEIERRNSLEKVETVKDFREYLENYENFVRDGYDIVTEGLDKKAIVDFLTETFPDDDWAIQLQTVLIGFGDKLMHSTYLLQKLKLALLKHINFDSINEEIYKQLRYGWVFQL
jgi:hypothetical protein